MAHARLGSLLCFALVPSSLFAVGCGLAQSPATTDAGRGAPDAPLFDDAWVNQADAANQPDAALAHDGSIMPSACTPQDAHADSCPGPICDGLESYAWDGERCVPIDCGACVGADCGHLVFSQAQCEANHASCIPQMCRSTGGEWLFWAEECQHYRCGRPQPAECLIGRPVCDCGSGRSFDASRGGCFDDTTCPQVDPLPPQGLCTATGGTWASGICCATHCGELCPLACASDNCRCGALQVFDLERGCIDDAQCHVHTTGQECGTQIRCAGNEICCQHCTGAGCDLHMTCESPVCDQPELDVCGNSRFAP